MFEITMCNTHFAHLKHEMDVRGLLHCSATSAAELNRKMLLTTLVGRPTKAGYDPLMHASGMAMLALTQQALACGVLTEERMDSWQEGPACILCLFNEFHAEHCDDAECRASADVEGYGTFGPVADNVLSYAQKLGYVQVPGAAEATAPKRRARATKASAAEAAPGRSAAPQRPPARRPSRPRSNTKRGA